MQASLKNHGKIKWKHVMHLIRLLLSGINVLRNGEVAVPVDGIHMDTLLAIKQGQLPWNETEKWRLSLHREFDQALALTRLPDRPNYEVANSFLVKARYTALQDELT